MHPEYRRKPFMAFVLSIRFNNGRSLRRWLEFLSKMNKRQIHRKCDRLLVNVSMTLEMILVILLNWWILMRLAEDVARIYRIHARCHVERMLLTHTQASTNAFARTYPSSVYMAAALPSQLYSRPHSTRSEIVLQDALRPTSIVHIENEGAIFVAVR